MRGLDEVQTTQAMIDGFRIYYNFMRPHLALDGKAPAEKSGMTNLRSNRWLRLAKKSVQCNSRKRMQGIKQFFFLVST